MLEITPKNPALPLPEYNSTYKISFEEFLVKYDGQFAEWVDGEVELTMSASDRHQDLVRFFTMIIGTFVEENDLGVIRTAPLVMKLDKEKRGREPDLLFVSNKNLHRLKKNYLDGAADLVIEIISPESRGRDRGDKFYEYESAGVKEYWLIDYEREQTEFYNLDKKGIYQSSKPDENNIFHSKVIKNLELRVDWLWQKKLPSLLEILKEWNLIK
jgi:Uma2 family endonuclease